MVIGSAKRKLVDLGPDSSDPEDDFPLVKKPHTRREAGPPGDPLCFICDHVGYLLSCAGPCLRSFHPRPKDGKKSHCSTLGFPNEAEIENFKRPWFCTNCKAKKHQCFICGELGESDAALGRGREVFVCELASCGRFYHPRCVAKELEPAAGEREEMAKGIQAGEKSFTCPLHMCKTCGQGEEKKKGLNLATCRRCPAAWHRKCFRNEGSDLNIQAWEPGGRFYCTKHSIFKDLGPPKRNHVQFKEKILEAPTMCKEPQKKSSTASKNKQPVLWDKTFSSADTAQLLSQQTSEDDAKRIVDEIVARSRQTITVSKFCILPTQSAIFNSMPNELVYSYLDNLKFMSQEDVLKCKVQIAALNNEEAFLDTFLAPTLHGNRYTSHGRHFTKVSELRKVVEALQPYVRDRDTIVDFCCGDNTFSRLLRDTLFISGKPNCKFKSFDIFLSKDTFGFEQKNWFSVGLNDCGPGDSLVIGLNPPYGSRYAFIRHALDMSPRILVLIIPPLDRPFRDYQCLLDYPMADKAFYLPGSVHASNGECLEQGNTVPPHLYIFSRITPAGKSTALLSSRSSQQQNQHIGKSVEPVNPPSGNITPSRHRSHDPRLPQYMPRATGPALQMEENDTLLSPSSFGSPMEEGEYRPSPPRRDSR